MFCFPEHFHLMTLDWEMCEDFKNYTWWQLVKQMLRIISETAKKFCSYYCAFVISDSIQLWYVVHSTQLQSSPLAGKGFLHACRGYIHFGQKISLNVQSMYICSESGTTKINRNKQDRTYVYIVQLSYNIMPDFTLIFKILQTNFLHLHFSI